MEAVLALRLGERGSVNMMYTCAVFHNTAKLFYRLCPVPSPPRTYIITSLEKNFYFSFLNHCTLPPVRLGGTHQHVWHVPQRVRAKCCCRCT